MEGFLCIDKPLGPSSFAVTSTVRRQLKIKKAGHTGTLDPYASGLLVVALEKSTRLIQYLPGDPKTYEFSIRFGFTTDTLDLQGKQTEHTGPKPKKCDLQEVTDHFTGEQTQTPPAYSAVKIDGTRAYKLARGGKEVEIAPRTITVFSLRLMGYDEVAGEAELEVVCSGGTYVRSLARDIAARLGTFGVVSKLRRTRSGIFSIAQAVKPDNLEDAQNYIIPLRSVFNNYETITLEAAGRSLLLSGRDIFLDDYCGVPDSPVFAFDDSDKLIAILRNREGNCFHPERVFQTG